MSPRESKYLGTVWEDFYTGGVFTSHPSERTLRFINNYFAQNYEHVPASAEAHFVADGTMDYVEVFAPFTAGEVAAVKLPLEKVSVPVEILYSGALVRKTGFRTAYLSEKSIRFLNAWIASRYHWSDVHKYALWQPTETIVRLDAKTGRPDKITVKVVPGELAAAKKAKETYLAML